MTRGGIFYFMGSRKIILERLLIWLKSTICLVDPQLARDLKYHFIGLIGYKLEMKVTKPNTLLLKCRAGGQGPYLRSLDHLDRSSGSIKKIIKKVKHDQPTNQPNNQPTSRPTNQPTDQPANQQTNNVWVRVSFGC